VIEKPTERRWILAGIYALSPAALERLPADGRFDVPDLIRSLLDAGDRVRRHEIKEFWMDVGRMDDFETALEAVQSWEDL
jgi:NDP-sugar pyrophosphorylase family protein